MDKTQIVFLHYCYAGLYFFPASRAAISNGIFVFGVLRISYLFKTLIVFLYKNYKNLSCTSLGGIGHSSFFPKIR